MGKITYANKVALNTNTNIADINKISDTDMNEIKNVVNENYDELTEIELSTIYSTNEVKIGTYKDKPLYRNCLELGQIGSSNVTNIYELSGDYEKITKCNARIEIDGGASLTLPMVSSEGLFAYCNASCTGDGTATINLYRNAATSWNEFNLNVDIEYTKTTD